MHARDNKALSRAYELVTEAIEYEGEVGRNLGISSSDTYNWRAQLNTFIDRATIKTAQDLEPSITFEQLQKLDYINAYKSTLSPNQNFNPRVSFTNYSSHFGTLTQAQSRFEIMEEDEWYIYRYTINLKGLSPNILIDNAGHFNSVNEKPLKQARVDGYSVIAYSNVAEGKQLGIENINLSLAILDSSAII